MQNDHTKDGVKNFAHWIKKQDGQSYKKIME
jgi:hypothetical protein